MAHTNHIGIRRVVAFDDRKIPEDQKGRTPAARRQQNGRLPVIRHRGPVHANHAQTGPFGGALLHLAVGQRVIKPARQGHLDAPGLALDPAKAGQIGGGRGQRIGRVFRPDVALAIAGEIHGIFQIGCGNELRMPHRPGPGSGHLARGSIPALQNPQRRHQLFLKERPASPIIGQRCQTADDITAALICAIGALQPPHGNNNLFLHAKARLDCVQCAGMIAQRRLTIGHPRVRGSTVQILPDRLGKFRLVAIPLYDGRVVMHPAKGALKGVRTDPLRQSPRPESADPELKAGVFGGPLRRGRR